MCSLKARTTKWPPFVIDPEDKVEHGFEIDFLKIVEKVSNTNIECNVTEPDFSNSASNTLKV